MKTKLLYNSKTSLLPHPVDIIVNGEFCFAVIKAEEERKMWSEKLFPGDDRDYEIRLHPIEISMEVNNLELVKKLKEINEMIFPLILFTYEGIKPRKLRDVRVIGKDALKHLDKNVIIFPNNPVCEREKRIAEEEQRLSKMDPNIWIHGG